MNLVLVGIGEVLLDLVLRNVDQLLLGDLFIITYKYKGKVQECTNLLK